MGFALEISEVGPAEFPLMEVLRETIFGELGHRSHTPIAASLSDRADLLLLMAHLEGNPVGFSAGFRRTPSGFYVNYLAVLRDYQRQGLGRQMMQQQESFARSRGYRQIEFNTFNRFPGMLRLGVSLGYRPIGIEQHDETENELAIRFGKSLHEPVGVDQELLAALERGQQFAGLVRDDKGLLKPVFR